MPDAPQTPDASRSVQLAVIPGDGIGPEVTTEALKVLEATPTGVRFETTRYDLGAERYLATGEGYALATGSILLKTAALYTIMITGSIWEKQVFGRWLFAPAFFWEDVVSMVVIALQTAYVACLVMALIAPPAVPRPAKLEFGPLEISSCSTAKLSRIVIPGSRSPSTKTSLRASCPRMM